MTRFMLASLALMAAAILYITAPSGAVAQSGDLAGAEHHMFTRDHPGPWALEREMEEQPGPADLAEAGPFELGPRAESLSERDFSDTEKASARPLENMHNHGEP